MKTRFEYEGGLEAFIDAYITCALWSSNDESTAQGGEPLDTNYSADDIAAASMEKIKADCAAFVQSNAAMLEDWPPGQAGHDFWLTRNGHGAGFWDRCKGNREPMPHRDALSDAANACGTIDPIIGDDGLIHFE